MMISVIGAGSWGTALCVLLGQKGFPVTLWVQERSLQKIAQTNENDEYLQVLLPENVYFTNNLAEAVQNRDIIIQAYATPLKKSVLLIRL